MMIERTLNSCGARSRASRAPLLLLCALAFLALCAAQALAQDAKPALPKGEEEIDSLLTKAGKLAIVRIGDEADMNMELRLKGRKVYDIKENMYASFVAHFRTYNSGELIVMSVSEGGTACPAQFQVVRVEGEKASVTEEFGDCGDSPTVTLQQLPEDQLTLRFQGYYHENDAQEPGFQKPPPSTWVYKKGVLRQLNAAPPPKRRGK